MIPKIVWLIRETQVDRKGKPRLSSSSPAILLNAGEPVQARAFPVEGVADDFRGGSIRCRASGSWISMAA